MKTLMGLVLILAYGEVLADKGKGKIGSQFIRYKMAAPKRQMRTPQNAARAISKKDKVACDPKEGGVPVSSKVAGDLTKSSDNMMTSLAKRNPQVIANVDVTKFDEEKVKASLNSFCSSCITLGCDLKDSDGDPVWYGAKITFARILGDLTGIHRKVIMKNDDQYQVLLNNFVAHWALKKKKFVCYDDDEEKDVRIISMAYPNGAHPVWAELIRTGEREGAKPIVVVNGKKYRLKDIAQILKDYRDTRSFRPKTKALAEAFVKQYEVELHAGPIEGEHMWSFVNYSLIGSGVDIEL